MKIYNAKLIGTSEYDNRWYFHFVYKSKFVNGYGAVTAVSFEPVENVVLNGYYDIYMSDKNGYHNLRGIYEHQNKNTDRNTIDNN